jgi:hypothetical protein
MSRGRSNKVIGQIGEFLACAEISRRCDCITTPFAGNVPVFDVLATDTRCRAIPLQVKTANGGNWQFDGAQFLDIEFDEGEETQRVSGIKPIDYPALIHVFVWLGHDKQEPDRFFLCTHEDFQAVIRDAYCRWLDRHGGRRPKNWESTHVSISVENLTPHENRWDIVTRQLQTDDPVV